MNKKKLLSAVPPTISIFLGAMLVVYQTERLTGPGPERLLVYAGLLLIAVGFGYAGVVRKAYE